MCLNVNNIFCIIFLAFCLFLCLAKGGKSLEMKADDVRDNTGHIRYCSLQLK